MKLSRIVSIFFGAGLLRPAPGTWGSVVAVALGLVIHGIGNFPLLAAATINRLRSMRTRSARPSA